MQKYMPSSQFNCYLIIITITIVDRKSTRLNSSHLGISYAVFCLKKKSTRLNSSHLGISYAVFCLKKKKTHQRKAACHVADRNDELVEQNTVDRRYLFRCKMRERRQMNLDHGSYERR